MKVDFKSLVGQYTPENFEKPLMIQWFFRPMPIVSFDQVQQTLIQNLHKRVNYTTKTISARKGMKKENPDTGLTAINTTLVDSQDPLTATSTRFNSQQKKILFEDPFLHINTLFTISFEVRLLHQNVVLWQFEKPFQLPDLSHRDFFQNSMEWFHCYEIIPYLLSGTFSLKSMPDSNSFSIQHCQLDIRVKCLPTPFFHEEQYLFDSTVKALQFQVKSCFVTHFAMDIEGFNQESIVNNGYIEGGQYFYLGGDPRDLIRRSSFLPSRTSNGSSRKATIGENEERNLAIQEAFERETISVLFDPLNYWFQDHILLRCFEFSFGHITNRCKLRWQSKLYVKQYTLHDPSVLDLEDHDVNEEGEGGEITPFETEKTDSVYRYPFKLDYRQILEDADLMNISAGHHRSQKVSPYLQEEADSLVAEELEDEEEEEETMLYEELLEIDARKKRPKFYDYITYEWTVSLYEPLTNSRRIVDTVCCDFQTEEAMKEHSRYRKGQETLEEIFDDDDDVENRDSEEEASMKIPATVPQQLLLPWMWEAFEVEIDQLRPSDLIILSGRVIQKELSDEHDLGESTSNAQRSTLRDTGKIRLPRKKDLRRLIKYLSIQVQGFESYLYLENEKLSKAPREKLSEMIPFIYPAQSLYALPSYELPYEQYLRHQAVMLEAEEELAHPDYQQYFLSEMTKNSTTMKTSHRINQSETNRTISMTSTDRSNATLRKNRREDISASTSQTRYSERERIDSEPHQFLTKENIHENITY